MNTIQPLSHDGPIGTWADNISADTSAAAGPLSFWRITDVPFAAWLAALERWQLTGRGSELRFGDSDYWSATSTALTLIPCQRVRPGTAYFRAGRRLLDSLTRAAGRPASTAASQPREYTPVTRPAGHPPAGGKPGIPGVRQPVPALAQRQPS